MLLWMEGIIAAYFWVHKPWQSGQNVAFLMAMLDVLLAMTLVAIAGGIGRLIFREWLPFSSIENIALQVAVGLGILSFVVLVAGLSGFIGVWQAWLGLGLGVLVFYKPISAWVIEWRSAFDDHQPLGTVEKASRWLVIFLIIIAGIQALAPPLKWDSLVYHLEIPQRYFEMGRIAHLGDNFFVGFPQLVEMIFTWAIALRAGTTATVLGWIVLVIAALGLGGFAERVVGKGVRWVAPAIFLSGASVSRGLSYGYVDLWVFFFGMATIILLDHYGRTKRKIWVRLSAVYAGFAFSTKYSAGMLLPIGVIYLFVVWIQSRRASNSVLSRTNTKEKKMRSEKDLTGSTSWRLLGETILIFVFVSLIIVSPWFIKNAALTGNPLYPFFFDGKDMDPSRLTFYRGEVHDRTFLDFLILPIEGTIFGIEGGPIFSTSISPLILALIPGVIFGWRSFDCEARNRIARLMSIGLLAWLIWGLASQLDSALTITRHYFGIFSALVILASFGFTFASRLVIRSINIGWLVRYMVIFVFILTAISEMLFFAKANSLRVVTGFQKQEAYIAEQLGWFGPAMEAVNSLPEDASVIMFWEPRSYYCEVPCSPDAILDRWWYMMRTVGTAGEVADRLRKQGFTHVLMYDFGIQLERESKSLFESEDWDEFQCFKEEELYLIKQLGDVYSLYEIHSSTQK